MISAGSVVAKFVSDVSDFNKGVKEVQNGMQGFGRSMVNVGQQLSLKLTAPLVALGTAAVMAAADFEYTTVAFTTMLDSAELAGELLGDLAALAKKSPFGLKEVEDNARMLLAMGSSVDEVIPEMIMLGDIASGLGVPLERLAYNFGQVRTQGKLTGRDLRDFAMAGVPIIDALAESLGVAKDEISDMVSAGKISFDDVKNALAGMSGEGGKFFNLMEKESHTFKGEISNLVVELTLLARQFGEFLLPYLKQVIDYLKRAAGWVGGLGEEKKKLILIIGGVAAVLGPVLIAIGTLITVVGGTTLGIGALILAAVALIATIVALVQKSEAAKQIVEILGNIFNNVLKPSLERTFGIIKNQLVPQLKAIWDMISPVLIPILKFLAIVLGAVVVGAITVLVHAIEGLVWFFAFLVTNVKNSIEGVVGWFKWLYNTLVGHSIIPDLINSILSWFSKIPDGIKRALSGVYEAITNPFRDAFNWLNDKINQAVEALKKLNPFHRESPSLVDNVWSGVKEIKKAYTSLGDIGFEAQISGASKNIIQISMAGATIADEQSAGRMAELMGDKIIEKLATVRR